MALHLATNSGVSLGCGGGGGGAAGGGGAGGGSKGGGGRKRGKVLVGVSFLCTALIVWLRDGDDSIEVSQKVVEIVWPRACAGWPQTQHSWKSEGTTKLELLSEMKQSCESIVQDASSILPG